MKKIISCLLCMLLVIGLYNVKVFAATNLVENESFENVAGTFPDNWVANVWDQKANDSELKVETGKGHTGSKFVTITNKVNNDARFAQKVSVEENKMYKLSCFIKTNNVSKEGAGACISIEGKLETSTGLKGTNEEWKQSEMYIKTGKGINDITVTLGVGGYGSLSTGTASFDDVTLEEVSSIPENAVVCNIEKSNNNSSSNNSNNASGNNSKSSSNVVRIIFGIIILCVIGGFGYYSYINRNKNNTTQKFEEDNSEENTNEDDDLI